MRPSVAPEHLDFFSKHYFIEFDDLIPNVDEVLPHAAGGYNVWKKDPVIKKLVLGHKLAEIASILFDEKPLRIGFDWIVHTGGKNPFSKAMSIQDFSCLQPLSGGLILRLAGTEPLPQQFPQKIGSGVYVSPKQPLNWHKLFPIEGQVLILIAYSPKTTLYTLNPTDPHTHELKREGYVFGDRLRAETHPFVCK